MENCGYHSDELKQLRLVLLSIISEAEERRLDLPVEDIIERILTWPTKAKETLKNSDQRFWVSALAPAEQLSYKRECFMDDLKRELSALEHSLAQLERGDLYKQRIGPKNVDVLAVVKAGYRRRIAGLRQRLA